MSQQVALKTTGPSELEPTLRQSYDQSCERVELLARQNERLAAALREIASADFRGNRPHSAELAYHALKGEGLA